MLRDPDPSLINDDLRPPRPDERSWSVLNMASLWVGMVVCVPTYKLAGDLVGEGMNWKQAVLTVLLGNVIVLVPMILNGHAGTKYGVPFPVLARASFGQDVALTAPDQQRGGVQRAGRAEQTLAIRDLGGAVGTHEARVPMPTETAVRSLAQVLGQ